MLLSCCGCNRRICTIRRHSNIPWAMKIRKVKEQDASIAHLTAKARTPLIGQKLACIPENPGMCAPMSRKRPLFEENHVWC